MNGVELTSSELAYLLATLECREVVGLEDPALFPSGASAQGKAYKKGRQELEEHGWIKPIPKRSEEYELDALLLEAVSILARPGRMIASTFTEGNGDSQTLFHYLNEEAAVELVARDKKLYWLAALDTQEEIAERVAELMHLEKSTSSAELEIEDQKLDEIKSLVGKGKLAEAKSVIENSDLDDDRIEEIIAAFEDGADGSLIAVEVDSGEIISGRRLNVYGSGAAAWMSFSPSATSSTLILTPCNIGKIAEFIKHFLEA